MPPFNYKTHNVKHLQATTYASLQLQDIFHQLQRNNHLPINVKFFPHTAQNKSILLTTKLLFFLSSRISFLSIWVFSYPSIHLGCQSCPNRHRKEKTQHQWFITNTFLPNQKKRKIKTKTHIAETIKENIRIKKKKMKSGEEGPNRVWTN